MSGVQWDAGSPCLEPRPVGMVYPPKPAPRYHGYIPDGSGVEWAAYDAAQMEAYARAAYAAGYEAAPSKAVIPLRDYFAGKVIQGFLAEAANPRFGVSQEPPNARLWLVYAMDAYALADAMLEAREAQP